MNGFEKLNNNPDNDLNIENAYKLSENTHSHAELCDMLKNGNIQEKQIAALKFDKVGNSDDAIALLNNLTGCDGKIREAVAYKINSLISHSQEARECFSEIAGETFAKATIDINANICRLIVNSARYLKCNKNFEKSYTSFIIKYTNEALAELDKFIFRDKKYVINKQLFKLYWCLEALIYFFDSINENTLLQILTQCAAQQEYTIREKCAEIIMKSGKYYNLRQILENDDNYYVKHVFTSSKHL